MRHEVDYAAWRSRATSSRLRGSSAKARTDAATTGPISATDCSASVGSLISRSIERKCRARVAAAFGLPLSLLLARAEGDPDVEAGPVALVELGHRVPDGFHGNWVGAA